MRIEGRYENDRHRVIVDGAPLDPARSLAVWNHSPDGFAWGFQGSGPAQLALAILLEAGLEETEAVRLHQVFKREVIAPLPQRAGFSFTFDVNKWAAGARTQLPEALRDMAHRADPLFCRACGHRHSGRRFAGICIGCPCPEKLFEDDGA